ncbi:MAG: hypothetical protein VXX63_04235 [Bacteroidota bacterium]|nr:hypothetical protein [Bacteroidota bacterium]
MKYTFSLIALLLTVALFGKENIWDGPKVVKPKTQQNHRLMKFAFDCEPASQQADLDINNVRTRILNGGDMWWDLSNARYEIPKVEDLNDVRKNSMFAGAIWVGGQDAGNNLRLAAMTYRQSGSDFWPGPLDTVTANTEASRCDDWDNIYKVNGQDIIDHYDDFKEGVLAAAKNSIAEWPAEGKNINEPQYIAPFFDYDNNGYYDPLAGDYPILQNECRGSTIDNSKNLPEDQPDQMLFFVYNDKGNIHSESQAEPIGLELQTTAFAYQTNDEINNMTFYKTRIINRGFSELYNTYFGQWVDPDLGNYNDDYVGCDVGLSLGICYNGDDNDEGIRGYGLNPPSVGVDFFEGPKTDTVINGIPTQIELGMSYFCYYNNDFNPVNGNPQLPIHYYYYLSGRWKNGDFWTRGGNGVGGTERTKYMFPFDTDPNFKDNWDERQAGNAVGDRRFLQSSGPFTLKPGAVNNITVGVVWARASTGGAIGSLGLLRESSRKAQVLFNNCFDILNGPDAPKVDLQELDQTLVFNFYDYDNDRVEKYEEKFVDDQSNERKYTFQGYRVYQLASASVSKSDLDDPSKAVEIAQVDLDDNIIRLVNQKYDEDLSQDLPVLKIDGKDNGLEHSFIITEDAFAKGANKRLVNNRKYYYTVVSYGALPGYYKQEYIQGRKSTDVTAIPHKTESENFGTKINGQYGSGPSITRIDGQGNGGNNLELSQESVNAILNSTENKVDNPTYQAGLGPVNITVIDPLKVPKGNFEISLVETPINANNFVRNRDGIVDSNTRWFLVRFNENGLNDTVFSDTSINYLNDQLILASTTENTALDWGLAVTIRQVSDPGDAEDQTNGFIDNEDLIVEWEDDSKQWLTAIQDNDNGGWYDWIRSGTNGKNDRFNDMSIHDYGIGNVSFDQFQRFEKIWPGQSGGGRIAPYALASRNTRMQQPESPNSRIHGVAYEGLAPASQNNGTQLANIASVDLVITPDRNLWTRVPVIEMGEEASFNDGGKQKFDLRDHVSIDQFGNENSEDGIGLSWFPGYALNVETGERLNIIISEDSRQKQNNGDDLKWNPTSSEDRMGNSYPTFGGRHYIYILGSYEGLPAQAYPKQPTCQGPNCSSSAKILRNILSNAGQASSPSTRDIEFRKVFFQCMWVIPSFLSPGYQMEGPYGMTPPSKMKLRIRASKKYKFDPNDADSENDDNPKFTFNTNDIFTDFSPKTGEASVEKIQIVPNPYYAQSGIYESSPVANKVKFTNLPPKCTISIYTLDGALVNRFKKEDEGTILEWNLKNSARVPISSGLYIIHVDAGDLGEKVLKWMGIMRQLDLDSF